MIKTPGSKKNGVLAYLGIGEDDYAIDDNWYADDSESNPSLFEEGKGINQRENRITSYRSHKLLNRRKDWLFGEGSGFWYKP